MRSGYLTVRIFRAFLRFFFTPPRPPRTPRRRPLNQYSGWRFEGSWTSREQKVPGNNLCTKVLQGKCYVIDGDTIVIRNTRIRLAGIDAPELDQPWGKSAKFAMIALCKGKVITAEVQEGESYDRIVAKCFLPDGTDLSAALVEQGLALDWAKFSGGAYRHLEPAGIRKKLWRVAAKHQGRLHSPNSRC